MLSIFQTNMHMKKIDALIKIKQSPNRTLLWLKDYFIVAKYHWVICCP